jgi:hypothetical protein
MYELEKTVVHDRISHTSIRRERKPNYGESVTKSTHAGIPWLRFIRQRLSNRVQFWPFDGWDIPAGRSAIVEVYIHRCGAVALPPRAAMPTSTTPILRPSGCVVPISTAGWPHILIRRSRHRNARLRGSRAGFWEWHSAAGTCSIPSVAGLMPMVHRHAMYPRSLRQDGKIEAAAVPCRDTRLLFVD